MRDTKKPSVGNKGFTLVEVTVAMAITLLVVGIIYAYFSSSSRAYTTQSVSAKAQQGIRVSMEYMVYDLRMAGFSPAREDAFGMEEATGTKIRLTRDTVDTTLTPPDYNGVIDDNDEERISYRYDAVNRQAIRIMNEGTASEFELPLLDDVEAFALTYFDGDGNGLGDPVATADLGNIRSVEIALTVQEPAGRDGTVTRTLTQRINCRNIGL
jgi:prepilin-type N-terminal cleavage/methylation domain-containing protein